MKFEWNDAKSKANVKKHGVTFDEAKSVFFEDTALLFDVPRPLRRRGQVPAARTQR